MMQQIPMWAVVLDYALGTIMWTLIGRFGMRLFLPEDSKFFFSRIFIKLTELASATTRDVVPLVRQRLKDIELHMPYKGSQADLAELAVNLLSSMSPEEVIDTLEQEHGARIGIVDLIQLAGDAAYRAALSREATEYELNRISPQQAADLWNDLGRPAPGGGLWNAAKVQALLLLKPD